MEASTGKHSVLVYTVAPLTPVTTIWVEIKFAFIELVNNNKMTMQFIHNCIASKSECKSWDYNSGLLSRHRQHLKLGLFLLFIFDI